MYVKDAVMHNNKAKYYISIHASQHRILGLQIELFTPFILGAMFTSCGNFLFNLLFQEV